jgi:predicted CopG family antitoxin
MKQIQELNLTKTIVISEQNYEKLRGFGEMGESFDGRSK